MFFEDNPDTWGTGLDWQYFEFDIEKCTEGRFLNENKTTDIINITSNYWCPYMDFNLKLSGSTSSKAANIIYLTVDYCK